MNDTSELPSDRTLVVETRGGSDGAWAELRSRHAAAVEAVARSRGRRGAQRATDAAFAQLREEIVAETEATMSQLPVRPRAIGLLTGGHYGPSTEQHVDELHAESEDDLLVVSAAFASLPQLWQTVLWHRWVERAPAAELGGILGRSAADVVTLERTAHRGLFDACTDEMMRSTPPPEPGCVPVIPLLGALQRGTLPEAQRRMVEAHLGGRPDVGCDACRGRIALFDRLPDLLADSIVPGLLGVDADRYRAIVGAGVVALGSSALAARRSVRARQLARAGAVAAVVAAVLAAAFFVRAPFGDLEQELADLLDRVTTTTLPDPSVSTTAPGTSLPGALPNRIELVFPGGPQGVVYVPGGRALDLSVSLSTPAPFYAGATGTIDAAITNDDTEDASIRFGVRTSSGVVFDRLADGIGSCGAGSESGTQCTLALPAGTTAVLALRFRIEDDVPYRVVVVTNTAAETLDLPVESVPGILLGQVGRGALLVGGATLGTCERSPECPNGTREASTATLDIGAGVAVERALLVWEGDRADVDWSDVIGLIPPGSSTAVSVAAGNAPAPSGALAEGAEPATSPSDSGGFRSVADVTDLVRAAGGGAYTVVRPPEADPGGGSWTLAVVTEEPTAPRRLLVVLRPAENVTPANPYAVDVPVTGSPVPPPAQRDLSAILQASTTGQGENVFSVDGVALAGAELFRDVGTAGGTFAYDLSISSTEAVLSLEATTTADALRLASIGLGLDLVP